ncbi:MAG: L-serine ammonia-lyase, iron-sulfur-dependent, subunit alpha [Marinifilaceae bacterium]|jgi:L-cysteine desulfidase|nr:L-serine ammonia-lyase, iron-sulfur-dependent, subunit alpha [Marinifilaceae bacterium]
MKNTYLKKLKEEFIPALGCTEPVAVAFAAAKAREVLNDIPDNLEFHVSGNIFKNGMGVGIPGSGMVGLNIAGALGAIGGNAEAGLEVLNNIDSEIMEKAKSFASSENVKVDVKYDVAKLYIECVCKKGENEARVIIQDRHTNVILVERNGKVIFKADSSDEDNNANNLEDWSFEGIYNFIQEVELEEIEFIEKGISLNKAIAEEGLKGEYGLQVGKSMLININKNLLADDVMNRSMMYAAAASDARMAGSTMPVMSNCGSGNQGVSVTLPVVMTAESLNADRDKMLRALALALLTSIYMKSFVGQLSALCGVLLSTSGAACGITYLMGGDYKQLAMTINNMTGSVTGMICDGAKYGCSHKISASVSAAFQSSLLALSSKSLNGMNGIIDDDVEATIRNIGRLATEGMEITDEVILKTMLDKLKKRS